MTLHAEKLLLIEDILKLDDHVLINEIRTLINVPSIIALRNQLKPMSHEEFYKKIEASERDYKKGQVWTQEEIKKEIETWKG
jgi:hypothetical protein